MTRFSRIVIAVALTAISSPLRPSGLAAVELSGNVTLDEADGVTRGHLERVKVLIANRQWQETINTLRQLADAKGEKVVVAAPGYYVRIRDFCHRRLAALPPEALALYRDQVDAQALQWLDDATDPGKSLSSAERERLLRRIVDQFYASSSGDEALWLLGEYALERGDYGAARGYWEQLIETPPSVIADTAFDAVVADKALVPADAELLQRHYRRWESRRQVVLSARRAVDPELMRVAALLREHGVGGSRGAYPGANVDPADVFARLILVSILEGSTAWAKAGLRDYAAAYPEASGRLAGREANYVEALTALLAESAAWPPVVELSDWPTFAGNPARNRVAASTFDIGRVKWRVPLVPVVVADSEQPIRRPAEDKQAALSYHPVVAGNEVFIHNGSQIFAYNLRTGAPAWGVDPMIYQDDSPQQEQGFPSRSTLGVPRFTLTVHKNRLYARMGSAVTSDAGDERRVGNAGTLVCLGLDAEGKNLWKLAPPEEGWSFEGTPIADDEHVYVALRKGGVRPQTHVACYDAETKAPIWRRLICSAESPGQGQLDEITHTLLTMVGDALYINTNLGAVASLTKHDGAIRWVTLYPRAGDDPTRGSQHVHRDLTPCLYDRGTLYVAPADSRHILAIDASTGLIRWESDVAAGAVHLLGVTGEHLFASGDQLSRINTASGIVVDVWPNGPSPKGYGRGVLLRDVCLWPTRTTLEVFSSDGFERLREVELSTGVIDRGRDVGGGNIVPAGEFLLIASPTELVAFDRFGGVQQARVDWESALSGQSPIFQYPELPSPKPARGRRRGPDRNAFRVQ
ncbi:MAG: hypothetical protein C0483_16955 [Pirellula sp.]|nr:hypothetical protein [Pirellula sp.]